MTRERSDPVALPRLLVFTDRTQSRRPLVETVAAAVEGGVQGVVLREKDLPTQQRRALAEQLGRVLAPVGGVLIAASRPVGPARGVHLAAPDPPVEAPVVGRSCHNAAEVDAASDVDYVTVSPVFATASKPGYGPPLGLDGLRALCARTPVKVYALGGVTRENAASCLNAGAAGVAVMGAVMRADNPAFVAAEILEEVSG